MKRTVQKITPARDSGFDQQFWPVLVALTVLSGITLGAVLTVLRGPWMWGSLLLLPVLAALAIFSLFHLDNNRLRRSLQFAIITSLALHLSIMVFASVVNIFQNPFKPAERQIAQNRVRTIEISDQQAAFIWQETNAQETPEPRVETEKQTKPTATAQPQTIPVPESTPQQTPQLVRRETTSKSVPRQNRELSKLRRQTKPDAQPRSSQQMTGEKIAVTQPAAAAAASQKIESSKKADTVKRQAAKQPEPQPQNEKPSPAPEAKPKTKVAQSSSSAPRRREDPTMATNKASASASPSTARVRRSTPNLPMANQKSPVAEKVATATTTKPSKLEPSKSSSEVTRRTIKDRTIRPTMTNQPRTQASPRSQIARSPARREPNRVLPSISNQTSQTKTPRRATADAMVASSPVAIEKPARSPESKTATRELNSQTLSVSRSTEGIAGVGRSKNLDRFMGGKNSPATRASDSARRERTQSRPSETRMLTSSQKSQSRRSVGSTRVPTSAFKSETVAAAKISGAKDTGERTMESSAAKIESASTDHRDESSAERGSANVDLGPTKVVFDRENRRRSGGGQQEVSKMNPEATRRSKDRSEVQPSLVASTELDVAAPSNRSTAQPVNDALEPSKQSLAAARSGGEMASTAERWSAETEGEISDQGKSAFAQQLADSRSRASRNEDAASWEEEDDEDEDEKNSPGNRRTRVASAPVVRSTDGFGNIKNDGRSMAWKTDGADAPSESVTANVARQATASLPGAGIGRTAANVLMQAATSLPIIDSAPARRDGSSTSKDATPSLTAGLGDSPRRRATADTTPSLSPSNSGVSLESVSTSAAANPSSEMGNLDSKSVSVSRSELASMEQVQGSQLDVIAPEGPAGLGERPDNFIGVMTRPASRESKQIQPDLKNRYRNPDFGGMPSINPDAVLAKDAFKNRSPAAIARSAEPTTEAAIHLGLEFLARYQSADGSWALTGFDRESTQNISQLDSDTAATGLALLAFQGAGYNHREFKYARQIDHAIQWLIENQRADGGLYVPSDKKSDNACRLYSHGIAALALTEAYGMTQDTRLKEPAQKAIDYILETQDPRKGGWRYFDTPGKKSADTSVSGWMMMALKSGRLAGLTVDDKCFDGVADWLDVAADPENESLYRYNPYARDSKGVSRIQGRKPTASMTAVGLLMRIYSGWDRKDPRLLAGADYLLKTQLPNDSTPQQRDTYYWYYATQVMKYVDGPQWKKWNDQLRPLLVRSQEKSGEFAGSWHPYQPVPDRWGSFGGRIYVTSMNLLSLEVRHRMLPLYKQNSQPPEITGVIEVSPSPVSTNSKPGPTKPEPARVAKAPVKKAPVKKAPVKKAPVTKAPPVKTPKVKPPKAKPSKSVTPPAKSNKAAAPKAQPKMAESRPVKQPVVEPAIIAPKVTATPPAKSKLPEPKLPGPNPQPKPAPKTAKSNPVKSPVVEPKVTVTSPAKAKPVDPKLTKPLPVEPKPSAPKTAGPQPKSKPTTNPPKTTSPKTIVDAIPSKPSAKTPPMIIGEVEGVLKSPKTKPESKPTPSKNATANKPISTPKTQPDPIKKPVVKTTPPENQTAKAPTETKPVEPKKPVVKKKPNEFGGIAGTVRLDGKILRNANVEFIPTDKKGVRVTAKTDINGRYVIASDSKTTGIKAGTYKVSITTYVESPNEDVIDFLEEVPSRYNSKTQLTVTVAREIQNAYDITLSSN
ncbi:MAG: hypothetical protein AB8B55_03505 [Mariniblastus sp.]